MLLNVPRARMDPLSSHSWKQVPVSQFWFLRSYLWKSSSSTTTTTKMYFIFLQSQQKVPFFLFCKLSWAFMQLWRKGLWMSLLILNLRPEVSKKSLGGSGDAVRNNSPNRWPDLETEQPGHQPWSTLMLMFPLCLCKHLQSFSLNPLFLASSLKY